MAATNVTYDTPAMQPPGNAEPNFDNPPTFYPWVLGLGIVCMVIMTISVGVRTFTKVVILGNVKHEDYVAIFALIGFLVFDAMMIWLSSHGLTRDQWNIRAVDFIDMMWIFSFVPLAYSPAMGAAKYFVCVQLRRIFCPGATSSRGAVWWSLQILTALNTLYYTSSFFTFVFQCIPREKVRHPEMDGVCINYMASFFAAGLINFILDLGILAVPVWAIWHLQLTFKRKVATMPVFAAGFFTCIVAGLGVAFRVPLLTAENTTREIGKVTLVTFVEFTGTLIVGCMPMFPRFYSWLRAKTPSSSTDTSGYTPQSGRTNVTEGSSRIGTMHGETSRKAPEYIELRDVDTNGKGWRPQDTV